MSDDYKIANDTGCFGNGDLIKTRKGALVYIRALSNTLATYPGIEDELEKLVMLKNK